jgi:hypothetical protein
VKFKLMAIKNTKLESEGAEFLVLGNLLINGIATYKTYTNMPGYDLVATNPERNTSAKIQVKSRWTRKATGFLISRFDCDFIVFAKLNLEDITQTTRDEVVEYFVFPAKLLEEVHRGGKMPKVVLKDIPEYKKYQNGWHQIREFLNDCA